ncbi:hypothetical protein [Fimbriiglobus ruber]|uniref:Uncharacterized protein n=1 Tax=Fimbriiglobus ruber TaxID=1908690 RepID=A0A225DYI8_9BACT|nr:hypothetical protein [Fimbriiglobus ruber]OWK46600.1 hypothetical protein FRUB_00299 [Fimbriiglobus ruber]
MTLDEVRAELKDTYVLVESDDRDTMLFLTGPFVPTRLQKRRLPTREIVVRTEFLTPDYVRKIVGVFVILHGPKVVFRPRNEAK